MSTRRHPRLIAALATVASVVALVAVFETPSQAKSQPTVSVGTVKGIGNVLVDSNKHTLYTLVNNHQSVECTGACLNMGFVPLTVEPGSKPTEGKGVKGLGVVPGGTQVTENGFPLFTFSADKPHRAMGQGSSI
jgi:predicted lipoprotein with Yx(FWY)xxD motif